MKCATKPDQGWAWVVMVASFGAHIVHGFFLYAIGILNVAFLENFQEDVGKTSWACGMFLGLYSLSGPMSGIISNRWSCRVCMVTGAALMAGGLVMSAFVNNLNLLFITFGLVSGLGAGLCYSASVVVVGFNFERHRNLATGMAVSGSGVGAFAMAPLMQMAKDTYGYSGLCLMCSGLAAQQFVFGALFTPSELEEKRKLLHKQEVEKRIKYENVFVKFYVTLTQTTRVLKNRAFVFLFLSLSFNCLGVYLMYVHFPSLAIHYGTSERDASYLLSVSGMCNAISRLLVGMASNSDNINELLLYCGCFSLLGTAGVLLPLYGSSYGGQMAFVIMLGMYSGCCYVLLNSITVKLVGIRDLASAFGMAQFGAGIGALTGPPLAGLLIDVGCTYTQSFLLAGTTVVFSAMIAFLISCFDGGRASRTDAHIADSAVVVEKATEKLDSDSCENDATNGFEVKGTLCEPMINEH